MSVYPILFEDHSLGAFRPLAWSTPVYELRCGILNARERIGLAADPNGAAAGRGRGGLLCRSFLAPLHGARGWTVGAGAVQRELAQLTGNALLLNGRIGPDAQALSRLVTAAAEPGARFQVRDGHGLLAICLPSAEAAPLVAHWESWQADCEVSGCWTAAGQDIAVWAPADLPEPSELPVGEGALGHIWDIVPATAKAISADLTVLFKARHWRREPFGLAPDDSAGAPVWSHALPLQSAKVCMNEGGLVGCRITGPAQVWVGADVELAPGTAIDASAGPVVLDHGVRVMPHVYLEGPLYLGPGSRVKAGACIYGESSFGIGNRLAGEIGESTFGDFTNKQHEGFIGHAVLGSWVNLGALTTCSDLKNNYGPVRVDLGQGAVETGLRFVGLLMGDHAKTAIGSLFNTGTCVGFASNIFGGGMPPKFVDNYRWGGQDGGPVYALDKAVETAAVAMSRRGCQLTPDHRALFERLAGD